MTSIDHRTRFVGDETDLDVDTFFADVERIAELHGSVAAAGITRLELPPLTLDVDGEPVCLRADAGTVRAERAAPEHLVVALDRSAFSDLMQDVASTFGLQMTGRATVTGGDIDDFIRWEPALRALLDGRRVYADGDVDFRDRDGGPLDLHRPFGIDDDPAEIGHFLAEAGFLHLQGVFTGEEMAAVSADLDQAVADADRDDGQSWWARNDEGWAPARILGFNQSSAALRELLHTERFRRIGTFTDDAMTLREPDEGNSAEGLVKRMGITEGISDVSWHKDCSMGGHSRGCCGLVVGLSVTGAGPMNGELGVVAGSNRANVPPVGLDAPGLPSIALPTETGDVTVHCSCTLHMSRPPVSAERRVVYTGFGLAPRDGDRVEPVDPARARADRASLNDHVRRRQGEGSGPGERTAGFELMNGPAGSASAC